MVKKKLGGSEYWSTQPQPLSLISYLRPSLFGEQANFRMRGEEEKLQLRKMTLKELEIGSEIAMPQGFQPGQGWY